MTKIIAFAGSARAQSWNKLLAQAGAARARDAGADVTHVGLRDYPTPLYDGDLEVAEGIPEAAVKLRDLMREHDGIFLACPEYNSSITPLLKTGTIADEHVAGKIDSLARELVDTTRRLRNGAEDEL